MPAVTTKITTDWMPGEQFVGHSQRWNVTAKASLDIISQESIFLLRLSSFSFLSTVRAGEKHRAMPKSINGSKVKPCGFPLHWSIKTKVRNFILMSWISSFSAGALLDLIIKHMVHVCKCLINNNTDNNILRKLLLISGPGQIVFAKFVCYISCSECGVEWDNIMCGRNMRYK